MLIFVTVYWDQELSQAPDSLDSGLAKKTKLFP